ncbi:VOC family protein [Mangrovibacterium lignilyticum]|uniref:VOC family protein n=1 Tax=Mangrovibacterium lignilyticum TaxID=2668052 RepID=UPI0013D57547|nr:VOC family protein [Mangrovibacterium lignilyticum]
MKVENPVVWFEIYVDDLQRAKVFYETVFHTELTELVNPADDSAIKMLSFPGNMETKGRASGALVKMEGVQAGRNSTIVYFSSHDCRVEEDRVAGAGGKVVRSKISIGEYGFISLVADTEGNMIGIHSMD